MRRRGVALALVCALAVVAGGCASVSDTAQNRSLDALNTQDPKPLPGLADLEGTPACDRDPYRSLAPVAVLPRPGHMPRGTLMEKIRRRGHLFVGVDQNTLGLGYFDPPSERMEGFDVDVVRNVARAIFGGDDPDDHIRYTALSTQQRDAAIPFHNVDIVASAYTINCQRRRRVRFSSVYHRAHTRLLVPVDSKIHSLSDLVGQPVCTTTASTTAKILDDAGAKTYRVELRSDCLRALQEREVPAISSDDTILLGFCRQDPQTKIVGPIKPEYVQRYGLAMDPDHREFVRFVNAVLKRTDLDGLRRHWFRSLGDHPSDREIRRCQIPGT